MLKTRPPTASALITECVAEDLSLGYLMQPPRRASVIGRTQPLLDEPEMRPEIWATMGSACATSITAENSCGTVKTYATTMFWQSQCAKFCAFQCSDLIKWVLVVEVSVLAPAAIWARRSAHSGEPGRMRVT